MQLTVREVAKLLRVSEGAVSRWIRSGDLPAVRINDQYRVNRSELVEWSAAHNHPLAEPVYPAAGEGAPASDLRAALDRGGVHGDLPGASRDDVLRAVVDRLPLPPRASRDELWKILVARETLASTGVGEGVAIPHARDPIVLDIAEPIVSLCYLARPVDFAAVDGRPVHVLFAMVSPTVRTHLHLLSRLSFALRDAAFRASVLRHDPGDAVLRELARAEAGLGRP